MSYNKKSIGPVFQFILWLLLFIFICIVGISDVFGLETKTIYSNQTLDNSNQFNYGFVNSGGVDSITTGSVGSRISGKTKYINFYLSQNVALNYTYTIRINFLADDLQPYFSLNHVKEISVCNSSSCSNSSIVSIKKQNNNGFSTWVELTFNPTQVGSVIGVTLGDNSGSFITGETFFGISSVQIESKNANQDVIDNATNNTNNIINNNNSNTESIINNNNENTQQIIDQFNTCRDSYNLFDSENWYQTLHNINPNDMLKTTINGIKYYQFRPNTIWNNPYMKGQFKANTQYTFSAKARQFDNINNYSTGIVFVYTDGTTTSLFINKTLEEYDYNLTSEPNKTIDYIRISYAINNYVLMRDLQLVEGSSSKPYEPYGEKICNNKLDEQTNSINNLNDSLNNSDSSGATSEASEFFSGFTTDTFGLTSIITAPLNLIGSITSSTCTPLGLPLPYVNKTLELPCMSSIYSQYFGSFFTLYQTITFGIIAYWVCVRIFNLVKDFKNPDHDEIEVLDL